MIERLQYQHCKNLVGFICYCYLFRGILVKNYLFSHYFINPFDLDDVTIRP